MTAPYPNKRSFVKAPAGAGRPKQLEIELAWLDAHVGGKPYGVDIVMPASYAGAEQGGIDKAQLEAMIPEGHRRFVGEVLARHNVPPLPEGESAHEPLLAWTHAGARSQVDIALSHPIKLLVNEFVDTVARMSEALAAGSEEH